jgi:uncharacterized protein (AIM24 family)
MSSVVISGDTSGQVTLAAPAVAGSNTITLPASTGTAIISDASANIQFNSGYGSVATAYGCRAWVNFNGTGTVAIRASGNVSSITDNGTGDYTVNFTTAMPDGFWAGSGIAQLTINGSGRENMFVALRRENNLSTTTARLSIQASDTATATDAALVSVAIFR